MTTHPPRAEVLLPPGSDTPRPDWRNAPDDPGFRDYSSNPGRLQIDGDQLRIALRPVPWKFLIGFACLFVTASPFLAWYLIPEFVIRLFFVIVAPMAGVLTFGIVFWVLRSNERLGDFLVINRATRIVVLPRWKKQFTLDQTVGLQRIRGRATFDLERETDLNLLVKEDGKVVRYHVMGNPGRRLVDQLVNFSGLHLDEIELGRRGYRDADSSSAGT